MRGRKSKGDVRRKENAGKDGDRAEMSRNGIRGRCPGDADAARCARCIESHAYHAVLCVDEDVRYWCGRAM